MRSVHLRAKTAAAFIALLAMACQAGRRRPPGRQPGRSRKKLRPHPLKRAALRLIKRPLVRASLLPSGPSRCWQVRLPLPRFCMAFRLDGHCD